jgi:LPXTG-motif cell wall-anchored protein
LQYLFDPTYSDHISKSQWQSNIRADSRKYFTYNPYANINLTHIEQKPLEDSNADADNSAYLFRSAYLPVSNDGTGTGLFQRDADGYWYYDSGQNAAWYNPSTEKFELYNYTLIPGHESFDIYGGTTNGNFLPFNLGHVEGRTDYQTKESLVQHDNGNVRWDKQVTAKVGDEITSKNGKPYPLLKENFRLITSDRTNSVNLNFGMVVEFDFYMPKDGMLDGNGDGVKEAMEFVFKGDDDVWVFIDDVLVLDIGGCHGAEDARINFNTGVLSQPDADAGYYKIATLKEAFGLAGKDTSGFNGNTFANFTAHTLKFFYMERGGNVSFCRLKFNMPQLPENAISVTKELSSSVQTLGNPDYTFALMAKERDNTTKKLFLGRADNHAVIKKTKYRILDSDGNYLTNPNPVDADTGLFQTDEYGIFKIKAGQTAVFEKITAQTNMPKFYVQELIQEADYQQYMTQNGASYTSKIKVNGTSPQWQGKINWNGRTYFASKFNQANPYLGPYGIVWYGVSSPDTDPNTGESFGFYFNQQNGVYEERLAKLSITKKVEAEANAPALTYKINVALDGEPLPEGTTYTVGTATRTVGFDAAGNSYVELVGGETAVISNILSGTQFHVWESEESAKGHTVTYVNKSASGHGENVVANTTGVTGTIRVNDHVQLTVTNTQHGTELSFPVEKEFYYFEGTSYTYTFNLWEMTKNEDGTFTQMGDAALQSMDVTFTTDVATNFKFDTITYMKHDFDSLPATKYYMIEETGETSPTMDNTMQYLVEVTIFESGEGIEARITNILQRSSAQEVWEDKKADGVVFVNTLTGSLTVTKKVEGGSLNVPSTGFKFTLKLENGSSGTTPGSFHAAKTDQNGGVTTETIDTTTYTFTLKHGESITFTGLPIGTKWTVTEEENRAFIQSWTVGVTSGTGTTSGGNVTIGDTTVAYTNNSVYELPETGGMGTTMFYIFGAVLMIGAAVLLVTKKRMSMAE